MKLVLNNSELIFGKSVLTKMVSVTEKYEHISGNKFATLHPGKYTIVVESEVTNSNFRLVTNEGLAIIEIDSTHFWKSVDFNVDKDEILFVNIDVVGTYSFTIYVNEDLLKIAELTFSSKYDTSKLLRTDLQKIPDIVKSADEVFVMWVSSSSIYQLPVFAGIQNESGWINRMLQNSIIFNAGSNLSSSNSIRLASSVSIDNAVDNDAEFKLLFYKNNYKSLTL